MKKENITAPDFKRKPYAMPLIEVVEINEADLICTSGNTEGLEEDDFVW